MQFVLQETISNEYVQAILHRHRQLWNLGLILDGDMQRGDLILHRSSRRRLQDHFLAGAVSAGFLSSFLAGAALTSLLVSALAAGALGAGVLAAGAGAVTAGLASTFFSSFLAGA
jgi:hypothetical protein